MISFGLCHEIIPPVVLKSFGLSQDLPLSQNGQNFRRKNRWSNGPIGATMPPGKGLFGPVGLLGSLKQTAELQRVISFLVIWRSQKTPCFPQVRLSFLFFHTWIAQNIKISEGKNMAFPGFTCELKNVGTPVNQQYKRVPRIHPALYFCVRKSRYRRIFVAWIPMLFC